MTRNIILSLLLTAGIGYAAWYILQTPNSEAEIHSDHDHGHEEEHATDEAPKGPHGGKLFKQGEFSIELVLYESGIPPEYHGYAYQNGIPIPPESVNLSVELERLGDQTDHIKFTPVKDFLRGQGVVAEPHSFDVTINARHADKSYRWQFSSYEGRTEIPIELAKEAGITTEIAGPAILSETVNLTGRVQTDPARIAEVRARFQGVVQAVRRSLGEEVKKGDVLAMVQSNESLQSYALKAPIDGLILKRNVQVGATTGDSPLFVIADLTRIWVELDVFNRDIAKLKKGLPVKIETFDGISINGEISFVSPLALHASQSIQARVELENPARALRPGQFVRATVTVAEHQLELAVRPSAVQGFRDFQVVFARFGDSYEVRMLELGRRNKDWIEVLGGLQPGTNYVTGNSYLIKADIEKSGASHDH